MFVKDLTSERRVKTAHHSGSCYPNHTLSVGSAMEHLLHDLDCTAQQSMRLTERMYQGVARALESTWVTS